MPSIDELYTNFKDNRNIVFLLVTNENKATVDKFLSKRNFQVPIYMSMTEYPKEFFSETIPATYVVNKKGEIVMKEKRATKWNATSSIELIDKLINE
jgi:peroxiredoxin